MKALTFHGNDDVRVDEVLDADAGDPLGDEDLTTYRWPLEKAPEAYSMFPEEGRRRDRGRAEAMNKGALR